MRNTYQSTNHIGITWRMKENHITIIHTYVAIQYTYCTYYMSPSFTRYIYVCMLYKQLKNLHGGTLTLLVHLASLSIQLSSTILVIWMSQCRLTSPSDWYGLLLRCFTHISESFKALLNGTIDVLSVLFSNTEWIQGTKRCTE